MAEPLFQRVAILGIGLMGGSLGLALRQRGLAGRVVGLARRETTLQDALRRGAADEAATDPRAAAEGADLVVLATPVSAVPSLARACAAGLQSGAILTDMGSTKAALCAEMARALPPGARFVGGHPMCGSEESGPSAAREDLFEGAVWAFTPTEGTDPAAVEALAALARAVGARPVLLDPESHDAAVAACSHLPHLVACSLAAAVADTARRGSPAARLCAGGFRDTTRVAESPSEIWRDILLTNRERILREMAAFREETGRWEALLRDGTPEALTEALERAREARRAVLALADAADGP